MRHPIFALMPFFLISTCFATNLQSTITHPVGSCYGGGVVFYVNKEPNPPAGHQGLIVALNDAYDDIVEWDAANPSQSATYVKTTSSYFSGLDNMHRILDTVNNIPNPGDKTWPAAQQVSKYNTSETCPTCTAWYFPSQDELATLYFQSVNFTNFWNNPSCKGVQPVGNYWSSSQQQPRGGMITAWQVNFSSGLVINVPTIGSGSVRAIRAF